MSFLIVLALGAAQELNLPKGDAIAPGLPQVTSWHFVEIDGKPTPLTGDLLRDDRYAIDIYPGGFVGYGGCNRFSGNFVRTGDEVRIQPTGSTRSACREPMMSMEQRLFAILAKPLKVSLADPQTLVLAGPDGSVRLRRTKD